MGVYLLPWDLRVSVVKRNAKTLMPFVSTCGYLLQPFQGQEILGWGERAPPRQTDYCKQLAYWNPKVKQPKYYYGSAQVSASEERCEMGK